MTTEALKALPDLPRKLDVWFPYTLKGSPVVLSKRIRSPVVTTASFSVAAAVRNLRTKIGNISDGLMLCLVNTGGSKSSLHEDFVDFPPSLLDYLKSSNALSAGSSTVPEWDWRYGLSFVQNYVRLRTSSRPESMASLYYFDKNEIYSWHLAVWANAHLSTSVDDDTIKIPLIMVFGDWTEYDATRVFNHYAAMNYERWYRLSAVPEWIFHDLNTVFGCWNTISRLSAQELHSRSQEVSDENFTGNVLQRMRRLNRAMATSILLRKRLHIQQNSMKEMILLGSEQFTEFNNITQDAAQASFVRRSLQVDKAIMHDLLVIHGILEQLQNLMTMIISIEQISSGQSVARLGILAFIFLPLSYAAAIFGITTWSIEPKWYPVAAITCLLLTTILAMKIPLGISWLERKESSTSSENGVDHRRAGIFESHPSGEITRGRHPIKLVSPESVRSERRYYRRDDWESDGSIMRR